MIRAKVVRFAEMIVKTVGTSVYLRHTNKRGHAEARRNRNLNQRRRSCSSFEGLDSKIHSIGRGSSNVLQPFSLQRSCNRQTLVMTKVPTTSRFAARKQLDSSINLMVMNFGPEQKGGDLERGCALLHLSSLKLALPSEINTYDNSRPHC